VSAGNGYFVFPSFDHCGANVMIIIFGYFERFSAKKVGHCLVIVIIHFFVHTSSVSSKKRHFCKFLQKIYLKSLYWPLLKGGGLNSFGHKRRYYIYLHSGLVHFSATLYVFTASQNCIWSIKLLILCRLYLFIHLFKD
jgi:hypothetical protein